MMRKSALLMLCLVLGMALAACTGKAPKTEVVVSAAASLSDALRELQGSFEANNPGVVLRFNLGSSGVLAQQIAQGAPVDLFISAAQEPMDALVKKRLVYWGAVQVLVRNQVVLVRPRTGEETVSSWEDLRSDRVTKVALGNPQHVPVGQYGQAVLEHLGLWGHVEPRLVLAEDVKQVLHFVESGEVQAGIVYRTDAARSDKVRVVAEAPAGSHPPVIYPMAVIQGSSHGEQARLFADYLMSPGARQILTKYGFTVGD